MADPQQVLITRVQAALGRAFGEPDADPVIRPSQFADFQANVALALAKRLGRKPRDVATEIVGHLDVADVCENVEISGPGFINLTLRPEWIAAQAQAMHEDERLSVETVEDPRTTIVEYSSPNVAKEMHAGHLRTTIVGDALARVMDFLGVRVIRDNHLGDWGTQYGMLIEHLLDVGETSAEALLVETDPNTFYQAAKRRFDADAEFAERSRRRVVLLQAEDAETMRHWRRLVELTMVYLHTVYGRLGITLTDDDIRGESFYNDMLADTADVLAATGVATISDGALCVFPPGFKGREGDPLPVIIRKSDGGYNYSTSDLAAIRYRVDKLNTGRMIYVVGTQQALHFEMVFAVARMAGWLTDDVSAEHAKIGSVLGADGKIFRTRSGDAVKLSELLDEAVERAGAAFDEIEHEEPFDAETRRRVVEAVGIGAVKYADLSVARDSEYVFDFDRMISFRGNTGPYLQYATARIGSIFRRSGIDPGRVTGPIRLGHDAERSLALHLLGFGATLRITAETAEPHRLCAYLFELASAFTTFYENCHVLRAPDEETRASRLALCALTSRTLVKGLELLGVETPERM